MINNIINIILAVIIFLGCLLLMSTVGLYADFMGAYNSTAYYSDIVIDKGVLTQDDYDDFIVDLGSTGKIYNVSVMIERKQVTPAVDEDNNVIEGQYAINWVPVSVHRNFDGGTGVNGESYLQVGDIVTVNVVGISESFPERMLRSFASVDPFNRDIKIVATVRNDGRGLN